MTPDSMIPDKYAAISAALLSNREAPADWGEFAAPESVPWSKKAANRFLLCCLLDYQWPSEKCWDNGYRLIDEILGDPDDVWKAITSISSLEWRSRHQIYKLHRFPAAHDRLHRIGELISARYAGDARRIWEGRSAQMTLKMLWDLGAGKQIGRMIVGALRDCGQLKAEASDVKGDIYVCRVLGRALLGKQVDAATAVQLARKLHPPDPWLLDAPLWNLGKTRCHASNPDCPGCYLAPHCSHRSGARSLASVGAEATAGRRDA
jgi:hypothetical protein